MLVRIGVIVTDREAKVMFLHVSVILLTGTVHLGRVCGQGKGVCGEGYGHGGRGVDRGG